jgi:hypothetical protein
MRTDSIEIAIAKTTTRTRRVWYGHGSCRLVTEPSHELPADVIDEAIAGFEPVGDAATTALTTHAAHAARPTSSSLAAGLSAQLEALDRQREQLAQLLRTIDDTH